MVNTEGNHQDEFQEASQLVEEAQRRLGTGDFSGAIETLDISSGLVAVDSMLGVKIDQIRRDVERGRSARRAALLQAVQEAFDAEPFNEQEAIWAIEDLNRFDAQSPEVEQLRRDLAERTRKLGEERQYQELRARLEAIWQEAQQGEDHGAGGVAVLQLYKRAHDMASAAAANYPSSLSMSGLERDASRRFTLARGRHELPTTLQAGGAYRELVQHLEEVRNEQGGEATVTFARDPMRPGDTETATVADAVEIVRRVAQRWADQKSQEYQDEARELLAAHSPFAAKKRLDDALDLYNLDEEASARVRQQLALAVQPAVARRERAQELLRKAELETPTKAWASIVEAAQADPQTPELEGTRRRTLERLKGHVEKDLLGQAKVWLAEANWQQAKELVDKAGELVQLDPLLAQRAEDVRQLKARCLDWEQLTTEVTENVAGLREQARTDPQSAFDRLKGLLKHWGEERGSHFADVSGLRAELEAKVSIEQLVARLEIGVNSEDERVTARALGECEAALEANPLQRARLEGLLGRLKLHKRYLEGLRLLEQNMVPEGLQLLKQVVDGDGDDKEVAERRREQIISDRDTDRKVTTALRKAKLEMEQERPDRAFAALNPLRQRQTQHSQDVIVLLEAASRAWELEITIKLEDALKQDRLDVARLTALVADLRDTLGSSQSGQWERRALSRCAAQQAEEYEQAARWDDAAAKWQEAKQWNPDSASYEIRCQQAQKQAVRAKAQSLDAADAEAETILVGLESQQPTDPEIKKWLSEQYLRQAQQAEDSAWAGQLFDRALKKAQEGLQLVGPKTPRLWEQQLTDLKQRIEVEEEIRRRQWEILRLLRPERSVDDYIRARQQADELSGRQGRRDLKQWWWDLRLKTLEACEKKLAEQQAQGAEIWDKLHTLGHILALEPDHGQAKDSVSELYGEVLKLQEALDGKAGLTKNMTGRGYPGTDQEALDRQLEDALRMEQRLNLAYQMLNHFGGHVQEGKELRNQLGSKHLRTGAALVSTLRRFKQLAGDVEAGIGQAKTTNSWRMVNDSLDEIRTQLGYAQHRTVSYLEAKIRAATVKSGRLQKLRQEAEKAAEAEDFEMALDCLARLSGTSLERLLAGPSAHDLLEVAVADDEEADPHDEYDQHRKVSISDPYTQRRVRGLRPLVTLLAAKLDQVGCLSDWLAGVIAGTLERENDGHGMETAEAWLDRELAAGEVLVLAWSEIEPDVRNARERGDFAAARALCEEARHGEGNTELIRGKHPLSQTVTYLETSPVQDADLSSFRAKRLQEQARVLLDRVRLDDSETIDRLDTLDKLEEEWQNRYLRFMNIVEELQRTGGIAGCFRRRQRADLRDEARTALGECKAICPRHPNLAGWDSDPLLQR